MHLEEFHDDTLEERPIVLEDPKTQVYLPVATTKTKGIASFDAKDFNVDPNGKVALNEDLHQIKENTDSALEKSQESLSNSEEALNAANEALEQVVEKLGSKVYINGVLQSSVNVDEDIQEQFNQLTENVEGIQEHFNQVTENVEGIQEQFNQLTENVEGIQEHFNQVTENVENIQEGFNQLSEDVEGIQELVPNQASSQNPLADKNFVNSSINAIAAFYITYDNQGNPFPTKAALSSATTFYSGGETRIPTRNDYCLVLADETHSNASCRYVYSGQYPNGQWDFQFLVNESPFTSDQIAAINSGITSALVQQIPNKADRNNPEQSITANNMEILGNLSFNSLTNISKKVLLDFLHPVNSIIEIEDDTFDPNVYYAGTGSEWVRLPDGYVLWSASSGAGTTIPAGLPNITGTTGSSSTITSLIAEDTGGFTGAMYLNNIGSRKVSGASSKSYSGGTIGFNASLANPLYGNSTTVQPPARKTCMWKRTA